MNKKTIKKYGIASIAAIVIFAGAGCTADNRTALSLSESAAQETLNDMINEVQSDASYNESDSYRIYVKDGNATYDKPQNGGGTELDISDGVLSITNPGTYILSGSGTLRISIDTGEAESGVMLVLNGIDMTSENGPAIYVKDCVSTTIAVKDGTENKISVTGTDENGNDAALLSADHLIINGGGSLEISAEGDGIHANDDVYIYDASLKITSGKDGIDTNDALVTENATLDIKSTGGDAITIGKGNSTDSRETEIVDVSDMSEEEINSMISKIKTDGKEFAFIYESNYALVSADDGIQAEGDVVIMDSDIQITSGGGSDNAVINSSDIKTDGFMAPDSEMKGGEKQNGGIPEHGGRRERNNETEGGMMHGMPSGQNGAMPVPPEMSGEEKENIMIPPQMENREQNAEFPEQIPGKNMENNDNTDDSSSKSKGISSSGSVYMMSGTVNIDSADDAVNAEGNIVFGKGTYTFKTGDDGIHSDNTLAVFAPEINIEKSWEGIEAENITINGGKISVTSSDDGINTADGTGAEMKADSSRLMINGGKITINSGGDGLDMNGSGEMNGGTVVIYGPENNGNAALDYNGEFKVNGGTIMAGGSSGMALVPKSEENLGQITVNNIEGTSVEILDNSGKTVIAYTSDKKFSHLVIVSDKLKKGEEYQVKMGENIQKQKAS